MGCCILVFEISVVLNVTACLFGLAYLDITIPYNTKVTPITNSKETEPQFLS